MKKEETLDEAISNAQVELDRLEALGYPASLAKACIDDFSYALMLDDGTEIKFHRANPSANGWVTIFGDEWFSNFSEERAFSGLSYPFPRGLDVNVSKIVWCADAPSGS